MLIPRQALWTLVAGGCASAGSLGWILQRTGLHGPEAPSPAIIAGWTALSHQNAEGDERRRDGPCEVAKRRLVLTEARGLEERQVAPTRSLTVFSTQTVTSTVTSYAGLPVTSTVFVTVTSTLTLVDPAKGQTTETFTVTSSPGPQTRGVPQVDNLADSIPYPTAVQTRPENAVLNLDAPSTDSGQEKRQKEPTTVTSVILVISRTVITAAPTVLVTGTATEISTLTATPPISITTSLTVTILPGSDGSPTTTIFPPTATPLTTSSTSPASSPSPAPARTPASSALSNGTVAGIVIASIFSAALLFALIVCCRRRKDKLKNMPRRKSGCFNTSTSTSSFGTSEAAEQGTVTHREVFGLGTSPPASIAQSASEQQQQKEQPPPTTTMWGTRIVVKPPSAERMHAPQHSPGAARAVGRSLASPLWRPGAMAFSHSNRANRGARSGVGGGGGDGGDDNRDGGSSSFYSDEAQPPSPVASSDILGPYSPVAASSSARSSFQRPRRDAWGPSGTVSSGFHRRDVPDSDAGWKRQGVGELIETICRAEEEIEENGRELWIPPFPKPGTARLQDRREERAVRFEELPTALSRHNSSGSMDGSSAFI